MIKRVVVTKGLKARGYVDGRYVGEDKRETAREELLGKRRGKPLAGAKKRGGKRGGVVDGNTVAAAGKKARRGRGPAGAPDAFNRAGGAQGERAASAGGVPPRTGRDAPRRNRAGKKTPFRPAFGAASASPSEVAEQRRMGGESRSGQFAEALAAQANVKRERLHKVLAQSGLGSRRDMEIMISSGRVMVNGIVATTGTQVSADDKVLVDHRPVVLKFNDELPRVLLYNKPEGEIVTTDDPGNRITVFDNLPKVEHGKWINIGRLDINTSGLLIFSTSGELANRFMHPRYEVEREYAVRLLGELSDEQRDRLLAGVAIEEASPARDDEEEDDLAEEDRQPFMQDDTRAFVASGLARFERIERREGEEGEGANHWYHVVLKEGRNREVRRMFEAVGLTVSRLIRTRFGMINLPPRLKRGMLLELSPDEVRRILIDAGMAELAGADEGRRARPPKGRGPRQYPNIKSAAAVARGGEFSANAAGDRQPGSGEAKPRKNRRGRRGRPLTAGPGAQPTQDVGGNRMAADVNAAGTEAPAAGGAVVDQSAGGADPGARTGRRRMRRNFRGRNRRGPRKGGPGEPGAGGTSGNSESGNS